MLTQIERTFGDHLDGHGERCFHGCKEHAPHIIGFVTVANKNTVLLWERYCEKCYKRLRKEITERKEG